MGETLWFDEYVVPARRMNAHLHDNAPRPWATELPGHQALRLDDRVLATRMCQCRGRQATEGSLPLREMAGQRPFFPLVPLLGIALALISGLEWTIWIPVLLIYTLVPLLDYYPGERCRTQTLHVP